MANFKIQDLVVISKETAAALTRYSQISFSSLPLEEIAVQIYDAGNKTGFASGASIENFTNHPDKETYIKEKTFEL